MARQTNYVDINLYKTRIHKQYYKNFFFSLILMAFTNTYWKESYRDKDLEKNGKESQMISLSPLISLIILVIHQNLVPKCATKHMNEIQKEILP